MSYKFSKGSQVIGDLKAADDTERNTVIDFGEDQIEFQTSGSTRLKVENTQILTTVPVHISGSLTEGLRIAKGNSDYREIQFETDGVDTAFIQVDSSEGLVIGCQSVNDEIIFMTTGGGGTSEVARMTATARLGVNNNNPLENLHVGGNARFDGDDVRIKLNGDTDSHPGLELYENGTRKWIVYNDYTDDKLAFKTDTDVNMVIEQDGKVGIGSDSPSHKLDINGDIRVRGNDIRDNSGNPAITFDGSANTAVVNDLTIGGNTFDANNKSIIKHMESGGFVRTDSNNDSVYLPEDSLSSQTNANYVGLTVAPFSGSIDKLIIRGSNNTNLSDLGDIVASVRIGNQGTNGYHIDNFPDTFEDVTLTSGNLGEDQNCTFVFTGSNFTPQDVYIIRLTPTNNWNNNGNSYINFTIVSSYIID